MRSFRRVQQASLYPHHCAVIPFKGNSNTRFFIDTGMELRGVDPHIYLSSDACVLIAEEIGWLPPSAVRGVQAELAAKDARIKQLEEEVKSADKFAEAAEYTLGRFGQQVRQKPGPKGPRKKEVAA